MVKASRFVLNLLVKTLQCNVYTDTKFPRRTEASKLAPIAVEILFVERSGAKRLERKAGQVYPKSPKILLQKKLKS